MHGQTSANTKMEANGAVCLPLPDNAEQCVVCQKIDADVTFMTQECREVMSRKLSEFAEDIRRIESNLAQDKPLFVHQDCLGPEQLSFLSAIQEASQR